MPDAGTVEIANVSKSFGSTVAASNVSLTIESGSFFSLLGPSGCGKTTLLRMIGGFESPDQGRILIGGHDVTELRPQLRPTAMVFQNYALFPTMTVADNVEYGLKIKNLEKKKRVSSVAEALDVVGLSGLEDRPVTDLSGGQQQRVALARAIVVQPSVLLFDEPLSNLDLALRENTRRELKELQRTVGITSIYVTHDQHEALGMSDRVAVMDSGRIVQVGDPRELYESPQTEFVASFLGGANIVRDNETVTALCGEALPARDAVMVVRPEDLVFSTEGLEVQILSSHYQGFYEDFELRAQGGILRLRQTNKRPVNGTSVKAVHWLFLDGVE